MKQFLITTTGTQSPVTIDDLGARAFSHPTSSFDMFTEFGREEIRNSLDLQSAIDLGYITVLDEDGNSITNVLDAGEQNADDVVYIIGTPSDWGSPAPLSLESALNEVASRLTIVEGASVTDVKDLKVSSNDTTAGYLENKVVGVTNKISITTLNDGGNEDLQITIGSDVFDKSTDSAIDVNYNATTPANWSSPLVTEVEGALDELALRMVAVENAPSGSDELIKISSNDTTAGYLENKMVGVANKITISTLNDGGNEGLQITIGSDIFDKSSDTAFNVNYTPSNLANWGSPNPTNTGSALDEAASRISTNETNITNLENGIGTVISFGGARNAVVTTNQYLRGFDGTPLNDSPWVVPYDCTIIAITASTDGVESWTAEVHESLVLISGATLVITGSDKGVNNSLSIDVAQGDELSIYLNGTSIAKPNVTVFLKRR